ncbi:MAG: hypothetical protein Q8K70_11510 [Bacteroidota bacterium]|nr:hypothetical protein [Bacteroidota bacterium]
MHNNLFVIGFNYHICSAEVRSKLSISKVDQPILLNLLLKENIFGTIISTCNRTELYGYGNSEKAKIIFVNFVSKLKKNDNFLFVKKSENAILHIFNVASGLDSQVIGDLEILGQFKNAFYSAKIQNTLNGYLERLANTAIQSAKEIRSETNLSNGTVSMSYFIVKYIKQNYCNDSLNVLIIGTGNFGKKIAYNIHDYLPNVSLTLCNRTKVKADELANKINCEVVSIENLDEAIHKSDVIVSSINYSSGYLIDQNNAGQILKKFIDMSIPMSVNPEIKRLGHIIIGIDEVSNEINQNIKIRLGNLPLANQIVEKYIQDFLSWSAFFGKSDSIKYWKNIIVEISEKCPHINNMSEDQKKKFISKYMIDFVTFIKNNNYLPKETHEIIKHFILNNDNMSFGHKKLVNELFVENHINSCHVK